jgi:hypothetical protein
MKFGIGSDGPFGTARAVKYAARMRPRNRKDQNARALKSGRRLRVADWLILLRAVTNLGPPARRIGSVLPVYCLVSHIAS